jgi:hypothetical protein
MMKNCRGLAALMLSIFCAQSIRAARHDLPRMKTILVFGDSLSDGFLLKRSEAYPALLIEKLRAARLDYQVVMRVRAVEQPMAACGDCLLISSARSTSSFWNLG